MLLHPVQERGGDFDARLTSTLQHAKKAPHYQKRWRGYDHDVTVRKAFAQLPVLRKEDAAEYQEDLVVPGVTPQISGLEAGVVSSSTTRRGRPLRMLRSPDEYSPSAQLPPNDLDTDARCTGPVTLQLYSPKHGVRTPTPDRILLPASLHANTVDVLVDLWRGSSTLKTLVVTLSTLKWVTVALQERQIDPQTLGVQAIGTTGYPLTFAARQWLSDAWACPLFDNYSLSEIPSYATECASCGSLHWESDDVILEQCVPNTGEPSSAKLGELVLTTLVPSILRMPLIRYATGDLVERTPRCVAAQGRYGFLWRGRLSHSLLNDDNKRVRVASGDLLEFGEATADIAQHAHPAETLGIVPPSDLGIPKIVVADGAICAELRYDPARFPARAASVAVAIREACVNGGAVPLKLTRPGTLDISTHARKL